MNLAVVRSWLGRRACRNAALRSHRRRATFEILSRREMLSASGFGSGRTLSAHSSAIAAPPAAGLKAMISARISTAVNVGSPTPTVTGHLVHHGTSSDGGISRHAGRMVPAGTMTGTISLGTGGTIVNTAPSLGTLADVGTVVVGGTASLPTTGSLTVATGQPFQPDTAGPTGGTLQTVLPTLSNTPPAGTVATGTTGTPVDSGTVLDLSPSNSQPGVSTIELAGSGNPGNSLTIGSQAVITNGDPNNGVVALQPGSANPLTYVIGGSSVTPVQVGFGAPAINSSGG